MTPTEETSPVRLSSPPEIIGAIPSFVGFHPSESLVISCLHGPRKRSGCTMRVDLPEPEHVRDFVSQLCAHVVNEDADLVVIVCYTEEPDVNGRLPRADLVDLLLDELGLREIGWLETLLVRDSRWWSYTCTKPCCPGEGTPLPASPSKNVTELEARRALSGATVLPGREALEKSVAGPVALRLIALQQRFDEVGEELIERTMNQGIEAVRQQTLALARSMLAGFAASKHEIDDADAARVLIGMHDKWPRDVMITWGLDEGHDELLAFLTALSQRAIDEYAAPICTVLAAVAYQHGNGALASVALDRALGQDPEYEMAIILDTLLVNRVHPREVRAMARRARRELSAPCMDDGRRAA